MCESEIEPNTQQDLATQIGLDDRKLRNYKQLNDIIPELQQMVENGSMKATVVYKIWAKMPREKFFEEITDWDWVVVRHYADGIELCGIE